MDSIRRNLDYYLALSPDHISAYLLTPDPDTPLGRDLTSGAQTPFRMRMTLLRNTIPCVKP